MPEFIVSVSDPTFPNDPVTSADIRNSLMYGGSGWRNVTVRKYDSENETVTSKISAIHRIRTLLPGTLLRDAKFLTDHAAATGSAEWSTVEVVCSAGGFRVIDNS